MNSPQKVQGGWVTAPETDFDPYANSSLDDPYPHFAKLRDLGPVFFARCPDNGPVLRRYLVTKS